MIVIVSGEGPADIGACANGQRRCNSADFRPGPMGQFVDRIAESEFDYPFHSIGALEFISEAARMQLAKQLKKTFVIGKPRDFETAHFFKEACALAHLAKAEKQQDDCPRAVVLFRDADGTRSSERGLYENRMKSIYDGFAAEDFAFGVAMVPKPKSEAWLICALKPDAYYNCGALEETLSGNDNAPEPAKELLEALLVQRGLTLSDIVDMVADDRISVFHIGMQGMGSFAQFESRLREVLRELVK